MKNQNISYLATFTPSFISFKNKVKLLISSIREAQILYILETLKTKYQVQYQICCIFHIYMIDMTSWEYYFFQTNNHKRFIGLKFQFISTLLKIWPTINVSMLQVLPEYHVSKFGSQWNTSGYFPRCLTKRGRKCLTKEVNLHICS